MPLWEGGQLNGPTVLWRVPEVTLCLLEIQSIFHCCLQTLKFVGTSILSVKTPPGTIITPVSAVYFVKDNNIFSPSVFSFQVVSSHMGPGDLYGLVGVSTIIGLVRIWLLLLFFFSFLSAYGFYKIQPKVVPKGYHLPQPNLAKFSFMGGMIYPQQSKN